MKILFISFAIHLLGILFVCTNFVEGLVTYSYYNIKNASEISTLKTRWKLAREARKHKATTFEELMDICGEVEIDIKAAQCTTYMGQPTEAEIKKCDTLCCMAGHKGGNCGSDYGFILDFQKMISGAVSTSAFLGVGAVTGVKSQFGAACHCTNNWDEVKCGASGTIEQVTLKCPFDTSACKKKCCDEGKEGGTCTGILKTSCSCDETVVAPVSAPAKPGWVSFIGSSKINPFNWFGSSKDDKTISE